MNTSDWIAIGALVVSFVSALFSWKSNEISKEANDMSHKSLNINYESTYNDFFTKVKKTLEVFLLFKEDIDSYPDKDISFIREKQKNIIRGIAIIKREKKYKAPTKYALYEVELNSKMKKIIKESNNILDMIDESGMKVLESNSFKKQCEIIDETIKYLRETLIEIEVN